MENTKLDEIIPHTDITSVRMILQNRLFFSILTLTILIYGCSREIPADPMCRTAKLDTELPPAAAACLIKSNSRLLAIKTHNDDNWNLPNLKLQKTTSAQCTAHTAVWKTTGLNVEVGKLLFADQHHTQYFECQLSDEYSSQLETFPVPPWASRRTAHIALIDPFETQQDQWVKDINLIQLREAYTQLK
ncbi:hypothetical protein [Paraglaciecola arctica]|uniref:hypothetical protein n=1 Tax=Paraglaciecola arctica TaxID=1128911 RepID=UPI002090A451|nr:hypothetical protein [Paraglaciecola arctica]